MPSKVKPARVVVAASEFSWLLAHHKITPSPGTLFGEAARLDADCGAQARLENSIFLTDQLGNALREAIQTDPQIRVHDAALDAIGTGLYFDGTAKSRQSDGLLVWKRPAGGYLLAYPLDAAEMLQRLAEMLGPVEAAPPPAFEGTFSGAALLALAATIDYLRTLFAASLLERKGFNGVLLRHSDIESQISSGRSHKDYRSLIALLDAFVPSLMSAAPDAFDKGMEELIDAELLLEEKTDLNGWLPTSELVDMASNLLVPLPALSLTTGESQTGQNGVSPHQLIALRGNSLWLLDILAGPEGTPNRVRIRGVDGLMSMIEIQGFLEAAKLAAQVRAEALPVTKPVGSVTDAKATETFCTACDGHLKPGAKFCTNCGREIQAP